MNDKEVRINFLIEEEISDRLWELARENDLTLSQFLRKMIKTNLERLEK